MSTLVLELHDAGILAVGEAGIAGGESPGYALYDGGALITGEAALARAREKPRWVHRRFWQDLGTEPLGRPFPPTLSPADLAHAQLSEVWSTAPAGTESVLLAIPGCFTDHQLGLLLGIAGSCGLPVAGMVDLAVAAAAGGAWGPRLLHLDVHLHRTVLTELAVSMPPGLEASRDRRVVRRRVRLAEGLGQAALQDAWARRIAELFVHATRFDPLHSAAAEQALYRQLPGWLARLRSEEVLELSLGPAGRERTVELTRPDVVAAADGFYDELRELVLTLKTAGESLTLLLSHHIAELPGLEPRLAGLRGVDTVALPAGAAARGALHAEAQIRSAGEESTDPGGAPGALPFITRLSYEAPAATAAATDRGRRTDAAPPDRTPTHLLHDGLAHRITEEPFLLGTEVGDGPGLELEARSAGVSRSHCRLVRRDGQVTVEDISTHGTFIGGEHVAGRAVLAAGDRLRLGSADVELQLIKVVGGGPDGTT